MLLFNVRTDLGERDDLTAQRTDIVARLRPLLAAWEKDVDAEAVQNETATFNLGDGSVRPPQPGSAGTR